MFEFWIYSLILEEWLMFVLITKKFEFISSSYKLNQV